jgi:uncharacterized protein YcbX
VPSVTRLGVTPVKGLALQQPDEILLERTGVAENRRFYLVDADGLLFAGVRHGPLVRIRATYDPIREHLSLRFPDGQLVDGEIEPGTPVTTDFYGRPVHGRVITGECSSRLSDFVGESVRLVRADRPGDACDVHVATLVSEASIEELGRRAGVGGRVDARRFRMLVGIDGVGPHEEDGWSGRLVTVGAAQLRIGGAVPRCAVTTQDPATGRRDLDTLRTISSYRGLRDGRYADFGVYADVERSGQVRVGDAVEVLEESLSK